MNKLIKDKILNMLKNKGEQMSLEDLFGEFDSSIRSKVCHMVDVLEGDGILKRTKSALSAMGFGDYYYVELTAKGYSEFKSWYLKMWSFITDDLAKLLSLVSIILSMLATYFSLRK